MNTLSLLGWWACGKVRPLHGLGPGWSRANTLNHEALDETAKCAAKIARFKDSASECSNPDHVSGAANSVCSIVPGR